MKITQERLENCRIALTIEPDEKQVQEALRQAARKISRDYSVPGFRKGKAPYLAVLRAYGKDVLYEQVVEDMGDKIYRQALEESGLEPIAPGVLEDVDFDPLRFRLVVPMPPEVDLGDHRSVRVERPEVTLEDAEVEERLDSMREAQAEWAPLEEGGAQLGDLVVLSLVATDGEGTAFIEEDDFELILEAERDDFPPGFDDQFVGRSVGDAVAFDLHYPEDWPSERANTDAHFEAEVLAVSRYELPPLDDDFAALIGDYDSLEALTESIRDGLLDQRQEEAESEYANTVLREIIDGSAKIEYPPVLLEDTINRLMDEQKHQIQRAGLPFAEYLQLVGQSEENYREQLTPIAEMQLRSDLVLGKLGEVEQLKAEDDEINERIEALLDASGDDADSMRALLASEGGRAAIASDIVRRKTIERMLEIANGTAPELEAETETVEAADAGADEGAEPESNATAEVDAGALAEAAVEPHPNVELGADTEA